jgi:uncharacterized protein YxeA
MIMRKTLIAIIAVTSLTAVGATAFAAQPTATKGDDLFIKANSTSTAVAEKAEPLKGVDMKKIALDDNGSEHGLKGEHGEMGEGMDD